MKSVVLKLVVLMVITGGGFAGYHWWQARANPAAQPYRLAKIERGAIQSVVAASGTLAAVTLTFLELAVWESLPVAQFTEEFLKRPWDLPATLLFVMIFKSSPITG